MAVSTYTVKELKAEAARILKNYRKVHNDKIRRYVFADVPFFISISKEDLTTGDDITLKVQIKNRETGWIESISVAI